MNARLAVLYIYIAAFLVGLAGLAFLPQIVWQYLGLFEKALIAFYVLVGFCAVPLAYYVYTDDERLELLEKQSTAYQTRLYELEDKMRKQKSPP